jgi:protein tyrosine phosphatase (PTP) superfamily phosphohydrolase (DUF442 family)
MKSIVLSCIIGLFFAGSIKAQESAAKSDSVEVIQEFRNLYRFQNFYLSGQPTYEALQYLKSKGVVKIINLRTERENSEFTTTSFNEEAVAGQMGMKYCALPVDVTKDLTPAKLDEFSNLLNGDETILIHCAGAGRVTYFIMAWLVRSRGYTINKAVDIGKRLTFSLPIEKLLGTEISMEFK